MLTKTKRLIPSGEVDPAALGRDALRYHAWDLEAVRARYEELDPAASYVLEAVFACERSQHRIMALTASGAELVSPVTLLPGGATRVRVAVPPAAIRAGALEIAIERREGPDALVSELRLFGSAPVPPVLTVVGDSRGGLIGTVSDAEYAGLPNAAVTTTWAGGEVRVLCDAHGMFRVPLDKTLPQGRQTELSITAIVGDLATTREISTRTVARGLRELPPRESRRDLAG